MDCITYQVNKVRYRLLHVFKLTVSIPYKKSLYKCWNCAVTGSLKMLPRFQMQWCNCCKYAFDICADWHWASSTKFQPLQVNINTCAYCTNFSMAVVNIDLWPQCHISSNRCPRRHLENHATYNINVFNWYVVCCPHFYLTGVHNDMWRFCTNFHLTGIHIDEWRNVHIFI